jgi:hypothetical protein
MKNLKLKTIGTALVLVMIVWACQNGSKNTGSNIYTDDHKATVKEVIQASSYTYLNVEEESGETFWIAINKGDFEVDAIVYFDDGLEMNNFESKDLQRTFETIYFVQRISDQPTLPGAEEKTSMTQTQPQKPTLEKLDVNITPAQGGISIATLFANRETYKDKTVRIKGQVTKVNMSIMGKNWIHIQDGTVDDGNFDLTITTSQLAEVGDVVTFEGKIYLNKDFGAGYTYEVIMEEAVKIEGV